MITIVLATVHSSYIIVLSIAIFVIICYYTLLSLLLILLISNLVWGFRVWAKFLGNPRADIVWGPE